MSDDEIKKARQIANKKYYQKIKDLRKKLTDFENQQQNQQDPDKNADFFLSLPLSIGTKGPKIHRIRLHQQLFFRHHRLRH